VVVLVLRTITLIGQFKRVWDHLTYKSNLSTCLGGDTAAASPMRVFPRARKYGIHLIFLYACSR